jgi:two-component system, LytTR family, sensor kinase
MTPVRILRHFLFWISYLLVLLYSQLFLSASFLENFSPEIASKEVISQLILLPVKLGMVYYVLYVFIPRWNEQKNKMRLILISVLICLAAICIQRTFTQLIIWNYIYEQVPSLTIANQVARYIYSLMDILQVTAIAASIKLVRLRLAEAQKEKVILQEKLDSEIRHLKSQLNPHFLFNSLNTIFALSRSQSEKTPDAVLQLSEILRYTLYESAKKSTLVSNEIVLINNYIALQQLRFGQTQRIEQKILVDDPATSITPLLLLPIIENAFKHGIASGEESTVIRIDLQIKDGQLHLRTENPFIEKESPNDGIGLTNIKRQLELLYKEYAFDYGKRGNIFRTDLTLNLRSNAGTELYHH